MDKFILTLFSEESKLKERSFYHVLKGKRSASSLMAAFLNDYLSVFGMYPKLSEVAYQKQLAEWVDQQYLLVTAEGYLLTVKGAKEKAALTEKLALNHLNFFQYGRSATEAWQLVKFAVQVVSYLQAGRNDYLPIETNFLLGQQLKFWLKTESKITVIKKFPQELSQIFKQMPQAEADFLARQFSGVNRIGKTAYQLLADSAKERQFLQEQQAIHHFLFLLEQMKASLTYQLVQPILQKRYNQSMIATKSLILAGDTIETVQKKRRLAKGTVYDHLLEWALFDEDFPYEKFLTWENTQPLITLTKPIRELQYREVTEISAVDYFTFRLYQIQEIREGETSD
ncbi:uncharacterized protein YpbB [Enterococcus sp. PF1-24]|uniref:helix-turn-helix domain-containing protein n=1 Tax=unclassified Enterococcus TaxID=2608891 RepID=UPI00247377FC|nr:MULTISPECIES: helix-turn-helix domain-containing protein [unclassified Enterococcus]MDH6363172.1 uncharacterized protein YpbB [Enterococcus sp. PFB1-1]MDH6400266.1 uncharacterized protein YpbB [Enterococcus sp. PF1-24]